MRPSRHLQKFWNSIFKSCTAIPTRGNKLYKTQPWKSMCAQHRPALFTIRLVTKSEVSLIIFWNDNWNLQPKLYILLYRGSYNWCKFHLNLLILYSKGPRKLWYLCMGHKKVAEILLIYYILIFHSHLIKIVPGKMYNSSMLYKTTNNKIRDFFSNQYASFKSTVYCNVYGWKFYIYLGYINP